MSNSLWVIFLGIINFDGPPQFMWSYWECEWGIRLSHYPWTISVGQVTFLIASMFWNLSLTSIDGSDPNKDHTASFNEVYGESKIKADGLDIDERKQAGPDPIDLPNKIISFASNLRL